MAKNNSSVIKKLIQRTFAVLTACFLVLLGFYLSLILTADRLLPNERAVVNGSIRLLESRGFVNDVVLLKHFAALRRNDNWLNASVEKENAYAATNFPFGVITLYPEFFEFTTDDVERAAVLLHESRHLLGDNEKEAYTYVWKNRKKLGWTKAEYAGSMVWQNVRKQTKEYAPELFICEFNTFDDCTEAN